MQGRRSKSFGQHQPNCESANEKLTNAEKITKTITGMTLLPAISQTGAQTAVEIFWSFSNKKQCFMIACLNILRCAAMKCNVLRLRHCTVKSKKLV